MNITKKWKLCHDNFQKFALPVDTTVFEFSLRSKVLLQFIFLTIPPWKLYRKTMFHWWLRVDSLLSRTQKNSLWRIFYSIVSERGMNFEGSFLISKFSTHKIYTAFFEMSNLPWRLYIVYFFQHFWCCLI